MKVLAANIEDVMREAAARWTLLAYFFLSTIFIIIFAAAVNLDVVDGTLAGAKLLGKDLGNINESMEKVLTVFEVGFSGFLYIFSILLAIFATAHLVPRMQDKGTVDLYLSRPVGRVKLLLARYVAGLLLAGTNVVYLMGTVWLIVVWKTHIAHPRVLVASLIIMFTIAVLLAFAFLVGVLTSSTAVSIMTTVGVSIFSAMLAGHEAMAAAVSKQWQANTINGMYWVLPKVSELFAATVAFVGGEAVPDKLAAALSPTPFLTTAAFGAACLIIASWLFTKKEF